MKRNVEEIAQAREDEFYDVHARLVRVLSQFGRHGTAETDDFWIPSEVEDFREFYVVLARRNLVCADVLLAIRAVLKDCRFIWVVVVHLGVAETNGEPTDLRVLEMTKSDVVVFENEFRNLALPALM